VASLHFDFLVDSICFILYDAHQILSF